ncbi:MAG: zinc-binding dehydrogenase [Caulobacteraceae bacterium]
MKAAVIYENGEPGVLRYETIADPVCATGGVVIEVKAVAIEGGDVLNRWRGALGARPHIVGYQAAGEIIEVGADVEGLSRGQRVVTLGASGSHASRRAVAAASAWVIPEGLDFNLAAVIPISFGTADECLFEFGRLKAGETVLVQAGASGLGVAAIQLAKRAGARVLATASSDGRLAKLKPLGMDHGINHRRQDVVAAVMRLTDNRGADLVIDPVGGDSLQSSILALAYRGRVVSVGAAGREANRVDVSSLMGGNRSLLGVFLGAEIATPRVREMIRRHLDAAAKGEVEVVVDRVFPLAKAAEAHAYIETRQAVGRVVLIP